MGWNYSHRYRKIFHQLTPLFYKMDTKKCPYCEGEVSTSAKKCKYCGEWLENNPTTSLTSIQNPETLIKQVLGDKYEIIEIIGKGGMANVYKAVQKNLNRPVALKIIHQNLIHDTEFVSRFIREAQLSASLNHPNIVTVYDVGSVGSVHYMAMELLDGEDLHDKIKRYKSIPEKKLTRWMIPIAHALHYIHEKDLIHRDIKSSNILITSEDRPVLMDFGIAHASDGTKLTQSGAIIGTPEYMSPEQAQGKSLDNRSDLYSLGIVMYECLAGKVPFKGDNPLTTIHQLINDIPPSLSTPNTGISKWLNSVVFKLLAKSPNDRFEHGNLLIQFLQDKKEVKVTAVNKLKPSSKRPKIKQKKTKKSQDSSISSKKENTTIKQIRWSIAVVAVFLISAIGISVYDTLKLDLFNFDRQTSSNQLTKEEFQKIEKPASSISMQELKPKAEAKAPTKEVYLPKVKSNANSVSPPTMVQVKEEKDDLSIDKPNAKPAITLIKEEKTTDDPEQAKDKILANRESNTNIRKPIQKPSEKSATVSGKIANKNNTKTDKNNIIQVNNSNLEVEKKSPTESYSILDKIDMAFIQCGNFQMGSNSGDSDESPMHSVTLNSFHLSKYECSQALWEEIMGQNPSKYKGADRPVENVSWNDVQTFLRKLNQKTGKQFRLPTEAEWEYAAHNGNKSRGYNYSGSADPNSVAWYSKNSNNQTNLIGQKQPNALGLFDMSGNVWEWCNDRYSSEYYKNSPSENPRGPSFGSKRTYRGGSFSDPAKECRVSFRSYDSPDYNSENIGFRLAHD